MDDGTFGYVLSSFGFNVETDVGINGCFAPFRLLGTRYLNSAAWFDKWWIWWYYSSVVASEYFSRRNVSVKWFCLICCDINTKQPISRFGFWKFRFGAIQFIIFSEVLIEDSNRRWDINSFVLSFFGFTVEAVVEVGESCARVWLSGHAARDYPLGWIRDGSDGAVLLLRLLLRVGCVEKAWNDCCVATLVWSFSPAWEAVELTPLRGGRHDGAEGAISTKQYTCLHWAVNEAICLSVYWAAVEGQTGHKQQWKVPVKSQGKNLSDVFTLYFKCIWNVLTMNHTSIDWCISNWDLMQIGCITDVLEMYWAGNCRVLIMYWHWQLNTSNTS